MQPPIKPPVDVVLARPVERIPLPDALPGGCRYEPKWDGYRIVVIVDEGGARLFSRHHTDLSAVFPELVAAATEQLDAGTVLDGELVVWSQGRLDFGALQQRLARGVRAAATTARSQPASLAIFDVLAAGGQDLRSLLFDERRARLEDLATGWKPPLNLSPVTDDADVAAEWFESYTVAGIEGLVIKGAAQPYRGGQRLWLKAKVRRTLDVICGAVIGSRENPRQVVAGLPVGGRLRIVGRTGQLTPAARQSLAAVLTEPAGPHPWPQQITPGGLGIWGADQTKTVTLTLVEPVVVEVSGDVAWNGRSFRHSLRFVRARPDAEIGGVQPPPS